MDNGMAKHRARACITGRMAARCADTGYQAIRVNTYINPRKTNR